MISNDLSERLIDKDENDGNETNIDFSKIFNNEYNTDARESEAYYLKHCKSVDNLARIFKADLQKGLNSNDSADLAWREKMWVIIIFHQKKKIPYYNIL